MAVPGGGSKETNGARPRDVSRVTQGARNCLAEAMRNTREAQVGVSFGNKDLHKSHTQYQKLYNVPVKFSWFKQPYILWVLITYWIQMWLTGSSLSLWSCKKC